MERLTIRDWVYSHDDDQDDIFMQKLQEYEDDEEDGYLVRLPFSFGDHIYEVYESFGKVLEWKVSGFSITPDATYIHIGDNGLSINAANIGRTVFRTREEAEARLAEMEVDNGNS